jgi:ribulose-5-phosphate 4-epimerase/fuculose-1-phosphate aldolase
MSASIRRVRTDLAACYRLCAHFRMTDLIYTHISARVPGRLPRFLINPYGLLFEEIAASNLVTVTLDGKIVDDPTGLGINPAGFVIHSAIHRARHDVGCVIHTHSGAGLAVAAQKQGSFRSRSTRCASPTAWPTTTTKASRSTLRSRSGSSAISARTTR